LQISAMPVTEALTQQKYRSMSCTESFLHEWLTRGWILESRMPWEPDMELLLPRSLWYKTAWEEFGSTRNFPRAQAFWFGLSQLG
jgi:hypothetical protein